MREQGSPLRSLFRGRRQLREEVDEELKLYFELRVAELEASGMDAARAREEAAQRFGDFTRTRAACVEADMRRERRLQRREYAHEFVQDVKHGWRQLRRRPGFASAAVLTLAIGIGANAAIFSAADHVLLRPLPYADAEQVVTLWETDEAAGVMKRPVSAGNFLDWAERSGSFSAMGLAEPFGFDLIGADDTPEPVQAWLVTEDFLAAAGVRPLLGRDFLPEEYAANAAPAILISHRLWRDRLGEDPAILGRTLQLDGRAVTIVGVLPRGLEFPGKTQDVWAPKRFGEREMGERTSAYMFGVARLRAGVSAVQAERDLDRIAAQLAVEHPATNAQSGVSVVPLREHVIGAVRPALLVLLGAVALVLLIACANVAGLLLTRGAERRHELGVRMALGAGRERLFRQLAAENLLLAVLGGALGLGLAWLGVEAFGKLAPPALPRAEEIGIDGRILAFAAATTLLTALLFGVLPALRVSRMQAAGALRAGGRTATAARERVRLRNLIVVGEVALALMLLAGAGLLVHSFVNLLDNELGFATEKRAAVQLFLWDRNPTREQRIQRADELMARFREVPGVESVAAVSALPFHPHQIDAEDELAIEGRPAPAGVAQRAFTTVATPEYFRLMTIPLVRGRSFSDGDDLSAPDVAVVNQSFAQRYFPEGDAVGARVTIGVMSRPTTREIVGVVGDVRPTALDSDPRPELYVPLRQSGTGSITFVVKSRTSAAAVLPVLRQRVLEVDPQQAVYHAATLEQLLDDTLVERRFYLTLLATFSLFALLLAAVGLYGVLSYSTRQRTGEIGLRLALGARPGDVRRMILAEGLGLGVRGIAVGLIGALLLTRFLESLLYDVKPTDPLTYVQIALLMLSVAAVAAYLPARRASALDPAQTLRSD